MGSVLVPIGIMAVALLWSFAYAWVCDSANRRTLKHKEW